MKIINLFISILIGGNAVLAQHNADMKTCPFHDFPEIKIYIPGYSDSIQQNGIKVRTIRTAILVNGFELLSSDSLLKIEKFHIVFDDAQENLNSKNSKGNKILNDEINVVPMSKINEAKIITIESITVQYKGKCYRIRPEIYIGL